MTLCVTQSWRSFLHLPVNVWSVILANLVPCLWFSPLASVSPPMKRRGGHTPEGQGKQWWVWKYVWGAQWGLGPGAQSCSSFPPSYAQDPTLVQEGAPQSNFCSHVIHRRRTKQRDLWFFPFFFLLPPSISLFTSLSCVLKQSLTM